MNFQALQNILLSAVIIILGRCKQKLQHATRTLLKFVLPVNQLIGAFEIKQGELSNKGFQKFTKSASSGNKTNGFVR